MNLRSKARAIENQGKAARTDYTPQGKPLDVYKWWVDNGGDPRRPENFCHFWRVVVIWAPIEYILFKFIEATNTKTKIGLGTSLYATLAVILGVIFVWKITIDMIGIPIVAGIVVALFYGLTQIPFIDRHGEDIIIIIVGALAVFVIGAIFVSGLLSFGWWFLLGFVGILAGVGIFALISIAASWGVGLAVEHHREVKKNRVVDSPAIEPKGPGIAKRFFSGVGDFLVLLAQIVRVKKWKICPIVKIED